MNSVSKTIFYFGFYELSVGLLFLFAPGTGVELLRVSVHPEMLDLLRIPGLLAVIFAYYYLRCGFAGDLHFARYSIHGRVLLAVAFPALCLSGKLPMPLITFGVVDFLGAAWTWFAFHRAGS